VQHGGAEHGGAEHGGAEHGGAEHGDAKVLHLPVPSLRLLCRCILPARLPYVSTPSIAKLSRKRSVK
jgi:hypothetical protein